MACKLQQRALTVLVVWLVVYWTNAAHLNKFTQRSESKPIKQINPDTTQRKAAANETPTIKTTSDSNMKTGRQLQLEIQELNRMQSQLKLEMVKGTDNAKKEKLLQHIKTQIQLRKLKQGQPQHQTRPQPLQQTQPTDQSKNQSDQKHRESARKQQRIQQKLHTTEPTQSMNKTKKAVSEPQIARQTDNQKIKGVNHVRKQRRKKQDQLQQQQQLHPLQMLKQPTGHTLQAGNNVHMTAQSALEQVQLVNNKGVQVHQNQQIQYLNTQNLPQMNNLQQQQRQYQAQQLLPQNLMQQRSVQSSVSLENPKAVNPGQLNFMGQQALGINQAILQPGTQQFLVPINALPLNRALPTHILPNERIIVVEAISDKNGQIQVIGNPSNIDSTRQKSVQGPPTTTVKPHPLPTTPSPTTKITTTTTAATTPSVQTTVPIPTTTYSYEVAVTQVNNDTFEEEFYKGEVRKQKLEIRKLQLEIRALQRNEMTNFSARGGENEDAPPQARIRFGPRRMAFPFF